MPDTETKSEEGSVTATTELENNDNIDFQTFEQILEMDDDDTDREFSSSIVFGFFEQAEQTFTDMEEALEKEDLSELSALGHFLKGSSATLGLIKVRDSCEKIQHYGQLKTADGEDDETKEVCLKELKVLVPQVKEEYAEVEGPLRKFFDTS